LVTAVAASLAVAAIAGAGSAATKTFTLKEARNATVVNQKTHRTTHENIVTIANGRAVYWLSGDSKSHPECVKTNHCFTFWPPVTVSSPASLSKGPGVPGTLGTWRRDGFIQVTLSGHPLYRYAGDSMAAVATGQAIVAFGGTWSVVKAATSSSGW
jgi:predicted lipoprotein with Yx(FWY)xxD motif